MRVIILGARSPASLEWLRALTRAHHQVWLVDSLRFPMSRFSRYAVAYYCLPPPRQKPLDWAARLLQLVQELNITCLIPTCEEVFYLSWLKTSLPGSCRAFCPDLSTLDALHNKAKLADSSRQWAIRTPESRLLTGHSQLAGMAGESHNWVFKPVYSRFATRTLIAPEPSQLERVHPSVAEPWLAQQLVNGDEFCSQSIFLQGRLDCHCLYQPRYRAGRGSGIYFDPADSIEVSAFAQSLGMKLDFTGQLGMDFIRDRHGKWWLLEANPRATSGVHLLPDLSQCFVREQSNEEPSFMRSPAMLALAMLVYGGRALARLSFWRDFMRASDVVWNRFDPCPALAQPLSLLELLMAAIHHGSDILSLATHDIEWNGEPLRVCRSQGRIKYAFAF
jgi:hypothetical protein